MRAHVPPRRLAAGDEVFAYQRIARHGVAAAVRLEVFPKEIHMAVFKPPFAVELEKRPCRREKRAPPRAIPERLRESHAPLEKRLARCEVARFRIRSGDKLFEDGIDKFVAASVVSDFPVLVAAFLARERASRIVFERFCERVELGERQVRERARIREPAPFGVARLHVRHEMVEHSRSVRKKVSLGRGFLESVRLASGIEKKREKEEFVREMEIVAAFGKCVERHALLVEDGGIRVGGKLLFPCGNRRLHAGVVEGALQAPHGVLACKSLPVVAEEILSAAQCVESAPIPLGVDVFQSLPPAEKRVRVFETPLGLRVQYGIREPRLRARAQRFDDRRAVCGEGVVLRELRVREAVEFDGRADIRREKRGGCNTCSFHRAALPLSRQLAQSL